MAVIVAVVVNPDSRRERLGITVIPSEAETLWAEFLCSLSRRGQGQQADAQRLMKIVIAEKDREQTHARWREVADTL